MIAERYLKGIKDKCIDTLVLGCTHYPLLKGVISRVMGKDVTLIDSAVEVAKEIKEILKTVDSKSKHQGNPLREFYVTDSPERFIKVGELFLENKIEHIEKISVDI
jgi:glutamate racemase